MPVRDAPDGRGEPQADRKERAPVGGVRFLRRYARVLVAGVAFGLIAIAALRGTDDHGTDAASDGSSGDEGPPTGRTAADESTVPDSATADGSTTTLTTLTPPDVAHERPTVDLEALPSGSEPVEVARWWAANYAVYVGAEAPAALADRLAPLTGSSLLQSLRDVPPAASYDPPLELAGVTGNEVAGGTGTKIVRVSVETDVALVVYDVTLTEAPPGSWLVSQASRV